LAKVLADYNDTDYQAFWNERKYEDFADKLALKRLLHKIKNKPNKSLIDIGGGYGRLAEVYLPLVEKATLFDYSQKLLSEAIALNGPALHTLQGNIYEIPTRDKYDIASMVRVAHHLEDLTSVLREIRMLLKPSGHLIIEIPNKRNLLEMIRFVFRRNIVNPFSKEPESRNQKGFYNYHPVYVKRLLNTNGFKIISKLSVSNFRSETLKKLFGNKLLMATEYLLQKPLSLFALSPSIYYLCQKESN